MPNPLKNNSEFRITAANAAKRALDIQANSDKRDRMLSRLWNMQKKEIFKSALDGETSVIFKGSFSCGNKLLDLGFQIYEVIPNKSLNKFSLMGDDELLDSILNEYISNFISLSKYHFQDEGIYDDYIRSRFRIFFNRAKHTRDISNDLSLLKYLNSETFKTIKFENGWDEFSSILIKINQLMNTITMGNIEIPRIAGERMNFISQLMPPVLQARMKFITELIEDKKIQIQVSWEAAANKDKADGALRADKMNWLAGKAGQLIINNIFREIKRKINLGERVVDFSCETTNQGFVLQNNLSVTQISIKDLMEVLSAKGYRCKQIKGHNCKLSIEW